MNERQRKQNLKLEKTQAVDRRKATRRIKQFFMLALFSLPLILYLSSVLTSAGVGNTWSIVIFVSILIVLWFIMLFFDSLIAKRAKKLRQIKNAQAVVDKYNAEVLKRKEEAAASEQAKVATPVNEQEAEPENKTETPDKIDLQNTNKNVIINNEEKKNKLKQKKYGGFNNKRKK